MPQGPIFNIEQPIQGTLSKLNISAATVVKAGPGRIATVLTNANSTTATTFSIYDAATTASTASSNLLFTSPSTTAVGVVTNLDLPCMVGIVVVPSTTSLVVAAAYS